jgi:hypothetical protein
MSESRNRAAVSPSPREAVSGWVLEAVFPNGTLATITGFGTESEANEWLGSARHVAWLRDTHTAFSLRAVVATFECLSSYAAILTAAASEFLQSARQAWRNVKEAHGACQTIGASLTLLLASALACTGALAKCAAKWGHSGRPRSIYWRSIACRCLVVATGALLIVGAVVAILAVLLVSLGRSEQPAGLGPGTPQMSAVRPVVHVRTLEVTEVSDPIAVLIDRVSSSDAATEHPIEAGAQESPPQPAQGDGAAPAIPAATPRHDFERAAPLGIVGIWAPETSGSCGTRNAREGALPAIISERGARAGETSCVFKNQRRIKSDWRLLAKCTNGHDRWSSNVRLAVKGDRLIWTSERGTQAYIRCRPNV